MPDYIAFKNITVLGTGGSGKFHHTIERVKIPNHQSIFYLKMSKSPTEAEEEVLAQEFLRVIIPRQPKTFIATDPKTGTYQVLSEEVRGWHALPIDHQELFKNGTYSGLGEVLVAGMVVNDNDMKNGNVGTNDNKKVVKIDGDQCFIASKKDAGSTKAPEQIITTQMINVLPSPGAYVAYNWLDMIQERNPVTRSRIIDKDLAQVPSFREEVNQTLLKILVTPPCYFSAFVPAYIAQNRKRTMFIDYFLAKQGQLKQAALHNLSFQQYLLTERIEKIIQEHFIHLTHFVAQNHTLVVSEEQTEMVKNEMNELKINVVNGCLLQQLSDKVDLILTSYAHLSSIQLVEYVRKNRMGQINRLNLEYPQFRDVAVVIATKTILDLNAKQRIEELLQDQLDSISTSFTHLSSTKQVDSLLVNQIKKIDQLILEHPILTDSLRLLKKRNDLNVKAKRMKDCINFLREIRFDKNLQRMICQLKSSTIENETVQLKRQQLVDVMQEARFQLLNDDSTFTAAKKQFLTSCKQILDGAGFGLGWAKVRLLMNQPGDLSHYGLFSNKIVNKQDGARYTNNVQMHNLEFSHF